MALRLLAWLVLAHALLVVQGNSGDSDGGSAMGPERCIEPDPRPAPLGSDIQDAKREARCHLECIERVCCS